VIEGSRGYRAERGYPSELWLLPPARLDENASERAQRAELELARDLLITLRSLYRCSVGYAGHDRQARRLISSFQLGRFYGWRLSHDGLDQFEQKLGDWGLPSARVLTVGELLELWLCEAEASAEPESLRRERSIIDRYINPLLGSLTLDQLTRPTLDSYFDELALRAGLKPRTLERHETVLRRATGFAGRRGYLQGTERRIAARVSNGSAN